ncbi:MAG: hypothetical protein AVO34_13540 [Firmicutes bacterium ML8_F2]|jgi:ParB-like chromosome segregation protein Spo0J|nr:MAG: hypothetical protein AVO34_13540 [Firmicutes bacterium ML8_F2]
MSVTEKFSQITSQDPQLLKAHPLSAKIYGDEIIPENFIRSIQKYGILEPIIIKPDLTIISGHRRWRAAKTIGLNPVPVKIIEFSSDLEEREALINYNFQREKTFSQKMAEAEELEKIEQEKARERQGERTDIVETFPQSEQGKTRDKVAEKVRLGSGKTYEKAKKIWEKAKQGDEKAQTQVKKIDLSESTVSGAFNELFGQKTPSEQPDPQAKLAPDERQLLQAWKDLKEDYGDEVTVERMRRTLTNRIKRIHREQDSENPKEQKIFSSLENISLYHSDFRELSLPENTADLVFTDPPYPQKYLHLWKDLGVFAARILKPGGFLIAYTGQFWLIEVLQSLAAHLDYYWMGSLVLEGPHNNVHFKRIRNRSKPLLFFTKGKSNLQTWFDDTVFSEKRDKELHEWQQSLNVAEYYIKTFTEPQGLVIDPFLGSGTTAVASFNLGRKFVGSDTNKLAIKKAEERLRKGV